MHGEGQEVKMGGAFSQDRCFKSYLEARVNWLLLYFKSILALTREKNKFL